MYVDMEPLKNFQNKLGINPDGEFGPVTANAIKNYFQLNREEAAHFLGQCAVETDGFERFEESLSYSKKGLLKTFPNYFTEEEAEQYKYKIEKISNKAYANRMGNGPEESGDGWKHRGFGSIQLTGKNNQYKFAEYVGDSRIKEDPTIIAKEYSFDSAYWYFETNKIWDLTKEVDDNTILMVSRKVNVGRVDTKVIPHGIAHRQKWTKQIYSWIDS